MAKPKILTRIVFKPDHPFDVDYYDIESSWNMADRMYCDRNSDMEVREVNTRYRHRLPKELIADVCEVDKGEDAEPDRG